VQLGVLPARCEESFIRIGDIEGGDGVRDIVEGN
jgi:hypothetical protein